MTEEYKDKIEKEIQRNTQEPPTMALWSSWGDHVGVKDDLAAVTKCCGPFKQDDGKILAFVGTDLDACVNIWSYNHDTKTYQTDKGHLSFFWNHKKGPGTKFGYLSSKDSGALPIALTVYNDIICIHLIKNDMWDTFNYMES
eukprot:4512963-Ditylum_brightwellii.AAC.1